MVGLESIPYTPGVYCIRNLVNGKCYVGSSMSMRKRLLRHRRYLETGHHDNAHLKSAWLKYGPENFHTELLEALPGASQKEVVAAEQQWIDRLGVCDPERGYNHNPTASGRSLPHTESTRLKMSHSRRGKPHSIEHTEGIRQALKGRAPASGTIAASLTPEAVARRAASRSRYFLVTAPDGTRQTVRNMSEFCRHHDLQQSLMIAVASGRRPHHRGWLCERTESD